MRDHLFHLRPDKGTSLQNQVREMLVAAILDGHIPGGSPLPSGRKLARQLGISRNTVVLAYQQLVDQGYLTSRERSGYFVNENILKGRVARMSGHPGEAAHPPSWAERVRLRPSAQRNIVKPKDWEKYPYPFIYGQFDPALFPIAEWRECCRQALGVVSVREWLRDNIDADDTQLIEQIHTRVLPRRGVLAAPEQILITVGAQQALYLIASLLFGEHTPVGIEDPGYADARNIFATKTSRLTGLAVDAEGLVVDHRLDPLEYLYVTPSHQFPTTVTMPLERRQALLRKAAEADFVIIEDDYESETNLTGPPTPALKSLDRNHRVIYVGSLSKTLAPGLRLGYMVGPADLIAELRALRRLMLRHPPTNNQRTIALFLARGHLDTLVNRLRHIYKDRWNVMGEALARHLPDTTRPPTFGGSAFWVEGPPSLNVRELERVAAESGILIEPGDVHFLCDSPPLNCFRLGLSSIPLDRIEPGIRELARLARTLPAAGR